MPCDELRLRQDRQVRGDRVLRADRGPDRAGRQPFVAPYLRRYHALLLGGGLGICDLVDDLLSVVDALAPSVPACFVSHDDGAQIGYAALARAAERFAAAFILASAHPAAIIKNMRRQPRQW